MLISSENLFLIILGLVWIIGAVLQDLRRREVDNLWNFSLIGFAIAYRASVSIYSGDYWFLLNGILGLFIFFILGNLFYYMKLFAGGDAKLMIALGPILPLSYNWAVNFKIFLAFILLFLVMGSFYVLIWSFVLVLRNLKRFIPEYKKQLKSYKKMFLFGIFFSILWIVIGLFTHNLSIGLISVIVLLFPILFVFAKSVEESCMIRSISPSKVTEGDWLYSDVFVSGKKIKADWDGVSKRELSLIRGKYHKNIKIKEGIPFTPGFLFGFITLLYLFYKYSYLFY